MKQILLPENYNYIAVFLTLACNLHCSYCIARFGGLRAEEGHLTGEEWVAGLNRIVARSDLPVTLQGGEPTLHPDFTSILNHLKGDLQIDLLTNLEFDIAGFMRAVKPERIRRNAPYASLRVSFHPETMGIEALARKVLVLQNAGYSIGIWGIALPGHERLLQMADAYCRERGIDFRIKEFLGRHGGVMHGTYRDGDACSRTDARPVSCRTSELIIGPAGGVYRCHADLYEGRDAVGHILDPDFTIDPGFRHCDHYGWCNPCDVKLKTDRFQRFGHTSVEIIPSPGRTV